MYPDFEITSRFDNDERKAILDPLIEYNDTLAGNANYIPLNILLKEDDRKV